MVAVAVLVVAIAGASRDGKADARLAGGVRTGLATYRADLVAARRSATAIARDPSIQSAVTSGDATAVRSAAETAARERGLSTLAMRGSFGTVRVGAPAGAVAIATAKL